MSDQPGKPEDGDSAPEDSDVREPDLLNADDVHLSDPDVSADAVEPTLNTSADEVHLTEPSLGPAEISGDAAEAASLDEAAAEAESVAREAENVGTLVAGPRPAEDPTEAAAPTGTAPAGGKAGDVVDRSDAADESADVPEAADAEVVGAADAEVVDAAEGEADTPEAGDASGTAADDAAAAPSPPEGVETSADHGADQIEREPSAELPSFAASGEEPEWTGTAEDQSRWDALFEEGQALASGTPEAGADGSGDGDPAGVHGDGKENQERPAGGDGAETAASDGAAPPVAPWEQPFPDPRPQAPGNPVPPVGGPYGLPPAGTTDAAPTRDRTRTGGSSSEGSKRKKLVIFGIIGLVVLALLIFAITSIVNALQPDDSDDAGSSPSTTPGADGIIADSISPLELEAGACILGFDPTDVGAEVTTVTCTTPHNAQLLATTSLPEDAEFPGEAALGASGDDLCNAVPIDENAAGEYSGLTLTQVTPTSGTWAEGDRRIDCFVVSDEGNVITDSLLAE